ncbi:QWRF motif protein (DUF566) [Rhynchospora pubera]|uniref:QWRF motif protein (DUF566) n=1 Tax=Rhynchospora pubera TaxID=906938 RepID=A0AAV8GFM1_9POAL|nr:QWRF motif protein (DUF566) [Rhynchospora pubera]
MDFPASDSVATILRHKTVKTENITRIPLLPSEKNSATPTPTMRKAMGREVPSRYKSITTAASQTSTKLIPPTTPKRYASPMPSCSSKTGPSVGPNLPKRAQSAERRRPAPPPSSPSSSSCSSSSSGPATPLGVTDLEMRSASGHLMWPSIRRLSSAFQSESSSIPTNKTTSLDQIRKKTPLKVRSSGTDKLDRWHTPVGGKLSDKSVSTRPGKNLSSQIPSTNKGSPSPARTRPTSVESTLSAPSTVPKQGKQLRGKQVEDAHQLRLNYNRLLQWRFVNARRVEALSAQKEIAEGSLYGAWSNISGLRDSVINKRMHLQQLMEEEKLQFILNNQIVYLEQWALLEGDHSDSLSGSIAALKASTLRLPVTTGTKADLHAVKNAVSSAIDVMQAMGSSVCSLLDKIEGTRFLVSELVAIAAQEKAMLQEYRYLLSMAAQLQVHSGISILNYSSKFIFHLFLTYLYYRYKS